MGLFEKSDDIHRLFPRRSTQTEHPDGASDKHANIFASTNVRLYENPEEKVRERVAELKDVEATVCRYHSVCQAPGTFMTMLATDGFVDQHGGEEKTRFSNQCLHTLLIENHHKPFPEQRHVLIHALEAHRGNTQRTDDVTLAGFKF